MQSGNISKSSKTKSLKTKVTLYYWPYANMNFGHVACVVEEIEEIPEKTTATKISSAPTTKPRKVYVSSAFSPKKKDRDKDKEWNIKEIEILQGYLDTELDVYKSPTVIKIELLESSVAYDTLKDTLERKSYNILTYNCAHLAGKVPSIFYPLLAISKSMGLLPSEIASTACSYLDEAQHNTDSTARLKTLTQLGPTNEAQSTTGSVSRVSKFYFAKAVISAILFQIYELLEYKLLEEKGRKIRSMTDTELELISTSSLAADKFTDALKKLSRLTDNTTTRVSNVRITAAKIDVVNAFSVLKKQIDKMEATLNEGTIFYKKFKRLTFWFYAFILIFSQSPEMKKLYVFQQAVAQFARIKRFSSALGIKVDQPEERPAIQATTRLRPARSVK